MPLIPVCLLSDGESLYAAAFGYRKSTSDTQYYNRQPDLLIARSNPYPTFDNLNWTVVSIYTEARLLYMMQYYRCTWNPRYSSVGMTIRTPNMDGYNLELSITESFVPRLLPAQGELYESSNGKTVLFRDPIPKDPSHGWIRINFDSLAKQLVFTYYGAFMEQIADPPGRWTMDETTYGRDLILTYRDKNLYVLGMRDTTQPIYIMSIIPLDTSTAPPTMPSTIKTVVTDIKPGCDLTDRRTTMETDKQAVYILCYLRSLNTSVPPSPQYQLYKFDGTTTRNLSSIKQEDNIAGVGYEPWIPAPSGNGSASWAYAFSNVNKHGYQFNFTGNNSDILSRPMDFDPDPRYISYNDMWEPPRNNPSSSSPLMNVPQIVGITIVSFAVIALLARVCQLVRRGKQPRAANADIALITVLPVAPAVNRELYGEDASDELPKYTPQDTNTLTLESLGRADTTSEPPNYSVAVPVLPAAADVDITATTPADHTANATSSTST
ncbi:hypothetical protein B0O80DRAFT_503443 [Mortierella sp. GBAus27b]|nr:hypothetical protein BGX31_007312 [Mortierella sp. GBA43]KAI8346537.1 hypothetical protein B0O80DRAFT_503443 [Mortierella sp. GBAus27b]